MKKKLIKIITLTVISLNTFLTHTDGDLPTSAKIFAEAVKSGYPLIQESLKTWNKTVHVHIDSRDITASTKILAELAEKFKLSPEFTELVKESILKIDTKDFKNPTFHLGESSQKTLLTVAAELRKTTQELKPQLDISQESKETILALAQALEKASANISQTGSSIGVNPQTAALLEKLFHNFDPSKFKDLKLSDFFGPGLTLNHKAELVIAPKTVHQLSGLMSQIAYIAGGLGTGALSLILAGLIANKHINNNDAEFTKADKVLTGGALALAIGAWALVNYSTALAGVA